MNTMKRTKIWLNLLLIGSMLAFFGCNDDDGDGGGPGQLEVESIMAAGTDFETGDSVEDIDLNAATSATEVPQDAVITITFSGDVDEASVNPSTITLSDGDTTAATTLTTSGAIVTLTPENELRGGTTYTLDISSDVQAAGGGSLGTARSITFTTAGREEVTPPQAESQMAYFPFDGNLEDATGNYTVENSTITGYEEDRFGLGNSALHLNGNGDIVDIANSADLLTPSVTISFWMKVDVADTNKVNHGMGIMGAAAERGFFFELGGAADASWLKVPTSHINADGGFGTAWGDAITGEVDEEPTVTDQWTGDFEALIDDKWVHVVLTYDESSSIKTIYIDGVLRREEDLSLLDPPFLGIMYNELGVEEAIDKNFAIGFYGASTNAATSWANYATDPRTFSGLIDDVRIFNIPLTAAEVQQLYDAESP